MSAGKIHGALLQSDSKISRNKIKNGIAMGKILRLQAVGDNTLQGWQDCTKYSTSAIDQIADPNGGSASKQITSIPSPFARI